MEFKDAEERRGREWSECTHVGNGLMEEGGEVVGCGEVGVRDGEVGEGVRVVEERRAG